MRPGGCCAGSLGAAGGTAQPQPFTRSWCHRAAVGRTVTFRNTPESRVSGSCARMLARRQHRRVGALLLCIGSKCCKMGTGGSLGFTGAGCTTGSEGQRLRQLGRGVKRPWSCGAGKDQALELTFVCSVVSGLSPYACLSFPSQGLIQSWVTLGCNPALGWDQALAGECMGSIRAACRAKYPETDPGPPRPGVSHLAGGSSAKALPLLVTIWRLQHGRGLHGVGCCPMVIIVTAQSALGAGDVGCCE